MSYEVDENDMCVITTINFMYVDRNANMMYDEGVDDQFAYNDVDSMPGDDRCCEEAGKVGDLETVIKMCAAPDVTYDDDFFYYEAPTCTRRYDRSSKYYTKSDSGKLTVIHTEEEHCVEEIVDV